MRKENLPFPESILRSEIMKKDWNYDFLSKKLGDNFIIKDITMSKGEGVSLIDKKSKTILDNENIQVAQKRIETTLPSSLRAMTFPNEIIGLFIYYNENDDLRSNYFPGYKKFSLNENILLSNKEKEIALRNGFNENLDLREDVKEAILKVSSIPSQSLLRGLDIIFDANNKFYFLEAQTNPGNSYADTYPLILRKPCGSRAENIQMGAEVIANSLEKYLTNHK